MNLQEITNARSVRLAKGFSLVEVLVCLGILAVLVSLILPRLSRTRALARQTISLAGVSHGAAAINIYLSDNKGIYPLREKNPFNAAVLWERFMEDTGYLRRATDVDPIHAKSPGVSLVDMSVCMLYDADKMVLGQTINTDTAVSQGVGEHQVVYPSYKGLLLQRCTDAVPGSGNCFCCVRVIPLPVALADSSARIASRMDFEGGANPLIVDLIGTPVFSAWNGWKAKELIVK